MTLGEHNRLCNRIYNILKEMGYDEVYKNKDYDRGEIDVYAIRKDYVLLFEVKSHHTGKQYKKAKEQLERARKYLFKDYKVLKMYVVECDNPTIKCIRNNQYTKKYTRKQ